jgi:ribose 1,5-bisphosphokinase PhnN
VLEAVARASGVMSQIRRKYPPDRPRAVAARQDLIAARVAARAHELMAEANEVAALRPEQIDAIAALLRGKEAGAQ